MKILLNILSLMLFAIVFSGCGKDNYEAPVSTLAGKVTYKGASVNLRGTGEAIQLQLFQDGYQKRDPIAVYVGQDGTFSALLFDGEYKLVTRDGNGPWLNSRDTTVVVLKGNAQVELKVTPYFTISNEALTLANNTFTASFTIEKVVSAASINKIMLILGKTQFVDDVNNILRKDIVETMTGDVSFVADLSGNAEIANAKALFGRVAVLAAGADQAIYSNVVKLK